MPPFVHNVNDVGQQGSMVREEGIPTKTLSMAETTQPLLSDTIMSFGRLAGALSPHVRCPGSPSVVSRDAFWLLLSLHHRMLHAMAHTANTLPIDLIVILGPRGPVFQAGAFEPAHKCEGNQYRGDVGKEPDPFDHGDRNAPADE